MTADGPSDASSGKAVHPEDISVVVPVGGGAPAWARAAASLGRLEPPPGELVVVLDGPDEDLEAPAREIGARVVTLERPQGPAAARNHGAEVAGGAVLFFLDADVEAPRGLIRRLAEILTAHPEVSAVIGSYDDAPGDAGLLSQYRNLLHHYVHQTGREQASTFWSGCGAVGREIFLAVGSFDPAFRRPSIEDIELGARLVSAGHRIHLAKELQVKHLKRWGWVEMVRTDLWRRAVPWTRLMLREKQLVNDLNVKTRERWSVVAVFLLAAALPAALLWPPALALAGAAATVWLALNRGFLGFLLRCRGALFTLGALPAFALYHGLCGLGFGLGVLTRHRTPSGRPEEARRQA